MDPLALRLQELRSTSRRQKRRQGKDVLVRCKKSAFLSNRNSHNRRGQSAVANKGQHLNYNFRQPWPALPPNGRILVERLLQFRQLRGILIRLLQLHNLLNAIIRSEGTLEHGCGLIGGEGGVDVEERVLLRIGGGGGVLNERRKECRGGGKLTHKEKIDRVLEEISRYSKKVLRFLWCRVDPNGVVREERKRSQTGGNELNI